MVKSLSNKGDRPEILENSEQHRKGTSPKFRPPKQIIPRPPIAMAQGPSYTYNPDLPVRKWHQKWINPLISLQNAPPSSHGTPAPTKEDGEVGTAGFKIRTWIPVDEDEDVTEAMLTQEVDWWSKPGAPLRPELRSSMEMARQATATPKVDEGQNAVGNVMEIEPQKEVTEVAAEENSSNEEAMEVVETTVSPLPSKSLSPQADTEMPDAQPSPLPHTTLDTEKSPSLQSQSPQPQLPNPKTPVPEESVAPAEPATIDDFLPPSISSPTSNPLAQAEEVAAGLAIETPSEQVEHAMDAGNLSGAGGGIAGEGIVGSGSFDLRDAEEVKDDQERTGEEKEILEKSKEDLDMEVVESV